MTNNFIVSVPVKPYVKRHIENNYGSPANFSNHPEEYNLVQRCLSEPQTRYDYRYENILGSYPERLEIYISEDVFYRYGWIFTRTDIVTFSKHFEAKIKFIMKAHVSLQLGVGRSLKESIYSYQETFKMDEAYWSYESIKKHYYRNKPSVVFNFFPQIVEQINTLFLVSLSPKKDKLTPKKHIYENHQ